jgi:3-dehydro-L-gulonate 2-dehydrogenase
MSSEAKSELIPYATIVTTLLDIILQRKVFENENDAKQCVELFAEATLDGVYSHGVNRFRAFIEQIESGFILPNAKPSKIDSITNIERYDGNSGPGNLNAKFCMNRAMEIARENGMGIVTIRNTNHWMRGGNYGWQAANAGFIGICWSNTDSCVPAWGANKPRIGNNPLVLAVPHTAGNIVLDMAMSQFSYGRLETARLNQEQLPVDGGYDSNGNLTKDPAEIEKSRRPLPIGYWKGSGLSILLDLIGAILSGGLSTSGIDKAKPADFKGSCYRCSQVFIAFDPVKISGQEFMENVVNETIEYVKSANDEVVLPGGNSMEKRERHLKTAIPIDPTIWKNILEMRKSSAI